MPTQHVELALQRVRDLHELLRRAHHVIDRCHRHEDKTDGEQHLIEMAPGIDMDIERALEQPANECRDQKRKRQPKRDARRRSRGRAC